MASNRAWASGWTGISRCMAMSRPTRVFSERRMASGCSSGFVASKWAYMVCALTPVSVRPAPTMGVGVLRSVERASSMVCCTEDAFGCRCQPWNGVPR